VPDDGDHAIQDDLTSVHAVSLTQRAIRRKHIHVLRFAMTASDERHLTWSSVIASRSIHIQPYMLPEFIGEMDFTDL